MPTPRQLIHARSLAQLGSFQLASQALHISQPALTRSIQALEATLDVQLFDRLPHGVVPTKFGEAFLARAQLLLQTRDDMKRELQLMKGIEKAAVRVVAAPFPYELLVPDALAGVSAQLPHLQCRIRLATWRDTTVQVLAQEAELGIGDLAMAQPDGRLHTELLGSHALHVYCRAGHPLLRLDRPTLADLAGTPLVATRATVRLGPPLGRLRGRAGTIDETTGDFVPAWEVDAVNAGKRLVAASDAIGCALLVQIETEMENGSLVRLPFDGDWLALSYGFILRRDSIVSSGTQALMDTFRRAEAQVAAREARLLRRYRPA